MPIRRHAHAPVTAGMWPGVGVCKGSLMGPFFVVASGQQVQGAD